MRQLDYVVFIGRFQLVHKAHVATIKKALSLASKVIIVIGSSYQPRTPKDPWTVEERKGMILAAFEDQKDRDRIIFTHAYDYSYNDQKWASEVQVRVASIVWERNATVGLIGYKKDETSFYLDLFPQWKFIDTGFQTTRVLNATEFRDIYFRKGLLDLYEPDVPTSTLSFLSRFMHEPSYMDLKEEHIFVENYKKQWEGTRFPVIFVTTDAVVIQSGHVLMIRRKARPGKGLLALPGGFLDYNERIVDSMIRELREETKLKVPVPVLKGSIKAEKVFDNPRRSSRGRTITHGFLIELPIGPLSPVKGGDDADKAGWVPLESIDRQRDMIYEDHADIIANLTGRL